MARDVKPANMLSDAAQKLVREHSERIVPELLRDRVFSIKDELMQEFLDKLTSEELYDQLAARLQRAYGRVNHFGGMAQVGRIDSSAVDFLQSGSATSRTAQDKLREIEVSITDYGASTSATAAANAAAIQEAHDDGLPSTGGTIKVPRAASAYTVALESVSFTKPVIIAGDGKDASVLSFTGNASNADGINTTKSLFLEKVTLKVASAPVTDLAMKGIQINNPATAGHIIEVEDAEILDFNFGVFADGRSAGGANFDIDRVVVRNSKIRISSAAGAVGEPVFVAGAKQATVELNELDNQLLGDHNVYMILCKSVRIVGNRLLNAYNDNWKVVTQGAGASGTLEKWTIEDNTCNVANRFGVIQPTGSIVIPKVSIKGNTCIDANSTTAGDEAGVLIAPDNTAIIRLLEVAGNIEDDVQLAGFRVSCATGAEVSVSRFAGNEVKNFGQASSGGYSAVSFGSLGTYRLLTVNGLLADGNSLGRRALDISTVTQRDISGVREINCTNPDSQANRLTEVQIGDGTKIAKYLSASATLDFPDTTASGGIQDLTITVTGAAVGDPVILGVPAASIAGSAVIFWAWVSATNTVTIRHINMDGVNRDPASATFRVSVLQH